MDQALNTGIPFVKMHGCGNDFVIIDRRRHAVEITPEMAQEIGDRQRGVGFDQLITIDEDPTGQLAADIIFWNADGSISGACGNGTRCVASLLLEESGKDALTLRTERGLLVCRRVEGGLYSVDMLEPRLEWEQIPLAERMDTHIVDIKLGPIDNPTLHSPGAVNMGNPHCVFFVERLKDHKVETIGPFVENHFLFPERANIGFAEVRSRDAIRLKVWERGVGMTLACGSGACAAVVAGVRKNLLDRAVTVTVDGGELSIEWREGDDHVIMTGPVHKSFDGVLPAELFVGASA